VLCARRQKALDRAVSRRSLRLSRDRDELALEPGEEATTHSIAQRRKRGFLRGWLCSLKSWLGKQ
jgi:hypothetical protein